METTGWLTNVELLFITSLLQIWFYVFAPTNLSRQTRRWIAYKPAFTLKECMAHTADYHLHLYHNKA